MKIMKGGWVPISISGVIAHTYWQSSYFTIRQIVVTREQFCVLLRSREIDHEMIYTFCRASH